MSVETASAPAVRAYLSRENGGIVSIKHGGSVYLPKRMFCGWRDTDFHCRSVCPFADDVCSGALAEDDAHRLEDDRFAGTGFPGEDIQPWRELQL